MTKFCPKCGNELSDDAEFCGKCGTNLQIINNVLNEDSDSFNEKNNEKSKDENKSKINIKTIDKKIIAIVIVSIALVGIGLMFVLGDGHQDNYQIKVTDASLIGTIGASYGDSFSYDLYGSIIPMPKNSTDISIQTDYYDSNGTLVESSVRTMPEIYPYDNSNTVVLGSYYSNCLNIMPTYDEQQPGLINYEQVLSPNTNYVLNFLSGFEASDTYPTNIEINKLEVTKI